MDRERFEELTNPPPPETVTAFLIYLCTDKAADINGQVFDVTGTNISIYSEPEKVETIQKQDGLWTVEELIDHEGTLQRASELQLNRGENGLFTHFVIRKAGLDTPEAVRLIAQKLDISGEDIGYAGNKDKKAITIQRMSVWKVGPRKLWSQFSLLEKK